MILEGKEIDVKYRLSTLMHDSLKEGERFLDLKEQRIEISWYLCDRPTSIKVGESNLINCSNARLMKENLIFYSTGGMAEEEKLKDLIIEDKELLRCGLDGLYIDSGLDDYPYPHDSAWYWFRVVYMGEELGASVERNVCALAVDLARANGMTMAKLFEVQDGNYTLLYFGKRYPLFFTDVKGLSFDGCCFKFPVGYSLEVCRNTYREFLRRATMAYVPPLVDEVAKRHGFNYGKITVKAVCSRYGSCSDKKNLNFSLVLAACDPEFINMVVCHELAHTVHLNHGPKFHELLDSICPDNRSISKKSYSPIIRAVCE
jgi:hypothetical protein